MQEFEQDQKFYPQRLIDTWLRKTKELIAALIIGALVFGGGSYAAVYFFVQTVG